ncbi:hypothetical protein JMJ35_010078 [Cladonia borealis]|uniref:Uncharacterized protein n=1 Tax=Cladonia borealis TaxID=184061 RepID=A0AA39V673_9LECA|nr:hypothetical protein JMJ35_010078 [Cladonia borealis]
MVAPLWDQLNRVLLLFSIFLTVPHIILFLDSTFPAAVCKNHAYLDLARNRNLLYLGSLYSAAISTWALSAKYGDFFSCQPGPPRLNGVPVTIRTSPAMAREKSRYHCVLKMVLLADITLAIDLSWAWYQGVTHMWSLVLVMGTGNIDKLMFTLCVLWLTMMWTLGNIIPLMAFGNMMSLGFEAGVEQVARWDRSSRRLENEKKEQ